MQCKPETKTLNNFEKNKIKILRQLSWQNVYIHCLILHNIVAARLAPQIRLQSTTVHDTEVFIVLYCIVK